MEAELARQLADLFEEEPEMYFVDKLHPQPPCQPAPVKEAATVHPMSDDEVKHLVNTTLFGAHQAAVACRELKKNGVDLSAVATQFPAPPPAGETGTTPPPADETGTTPPPRAATTPSETTRWGQSGQSG